MRTFEELLADHATEIYSYALRLTGDRDEADDVFQETFLAAFRAYARTHDANRRAWLYRIATNKARDRHRRKAREVRLADLEIDGWPARAKGTARPGRLLLAGPPRDDVALVDLAAAVRALADGERAAFVLRRVQGLAYAEVARVLGCSAVAARQRVSVATRKVKEALR